MALPIVGRIAAAAKTSVGNLMKRSAIGPDSRFVFGVAEELAKYGIFRKFTGEVWEEVAEQTANEILAYATVLAPIEFGGLVESGYVKKEGSGLDVVYYIGFSAPYALYVHEQIAMKLRGQKRQGVGRRGRYWDIQGVASARYLARAVEENQTLIRRRIQAGWGEKMKVKMLKLK